MDEFNDNEITKLLRLKRYEQPPPGYFDNFLHEFHRRQRDELLREPLWRICLERAHDFMFRLNVPSLTSYPAVAAAVLICAAVISLKVYQPAPAEVALQSRPAVSADPEWTLASPVSVRSLNTQPLRQSNQSAHTHSRNSGTPPRYVLDSIPVSYESIRF
ncbi:MAG: hypothetical protein ABI925_12115 [Verrucomicrobiota bacterium]